MGKHYEYLKIFSSFLNNIMAVLSGALLLGLTIIYLINIFAREVGRPIQGLVTIAILLMVASVYLGYARAEEFREHANITLLFELLPKKGTAILNIICEFLKLITISMFLYATYSGFVISYEVGTLAADVIKLKLWPTRLAMLLGLIAFEIQVLIHFIDSIIDYKNLNGKKL